MINRIRAILGGTNSSAEVTDIKSPSEDKHLAMAALLVEVAYVDTSFHERERQVILDLVSNRFGLADDEALSLIQAAELAQQGASDLVQFTRRLKEHYSAEERIELIEMLWEVVYADGRVDDFEASLMRRIGGLLYVSERERGSAQKRVVKRLGNDSDGEQ